MFRHYPSSPSTLCWTMRMASRCVGVATVVGQCAGVVVGFSLPCCLIHSDAECSFIPLSQQRKQCGCVAVWGRTCTSRRPLRLFHGKRGFGRCTIAFFDSWVFGDKPGVCDVVQSCVSIGSVHIETCCTGQVPPTSGAIIGMLVGRQVGASCCIRAVPLGVVRCCIFPGFPATSHEIGQRMSAELRCLGHACLLILANPA